MKWMTHHQGALFFLFLFFFFLTRSDVWERKQNLFQVLIRTPLEVQTREYNKEVHFLFFIFKGRVGYCKMIRSNCDHHPLGLDLWIVDLYSLVSSVSCFCPFLRATPPPPPPSIVSAPSSASLPLPQHLVCCCCHSLSFYCQAVCSMQCFMDS